ncbi:MAG: VPLPA-CTERM sorting domain-containing protein [Gammaproteobacteria bacterium]|nr:VPLPA-CTERM sorting domain-containing protein [Gammaproteobacteria bacterium]NND54684.1 VPLPA-CTERM sorting domain-containing protein [Gammaproteobacteria bacterium]
MKKLSQLTFVLGCLLAANLSFAAPVEYSVSTTVAAVEGSYVGDVLIGHTITGSFIVDNDTANAGPGSDPNPSNNPGHEYSSFWDFPGAPYEASIFNTNLGAGFSNTAPPAVVVNDNLFLTSDETAGLLPDGTYDWIEILSSSTSDYCPGGGAPCTPADGEEWTLAIIADASWFTDGAAIPAGLPASYTAFLIGFEFDAVGNEVGLVFAPVDTLSVSVVPVPAAAWLFVSALGGLSLLRRRG